MRTTVLLAVLGCLAFAVAACSGSTPSGQSSPAHPVSPTPTPTPTSATPTTSSAAPTSSSAVARTTAKPKPKPKPKSTTKPKPAPPRHTSAAHRLEPRTLPLHLSTGDARQVITVVAPSSSSTYATLQAWRKVTGGWRPVGGAVDARVGSAGVGQASEGSSKTPAGSFTLTQAFGRMSDPGTPLPYFKTRPSDWWISESGSLYNTHQRCSSGCGFRQGDPNEHLYYETPYYNYAVVIDYNTRNAPGGVHQGAGSAFFLHVSVGASTAGCVAIPQDDLVTIMRWLAPGEHPRILIGVR